MSYLDIHERMRVVKIIQELSQSGKRVIVIEHGLRFWMSFVI